MHPVLMGALGASAMLGGVALVVWLNLQKPNLDPPPNRPPAEEGISAPLMAALVVGTILLPPVGLVAGAAGLADRNRPKRSQGATLVILAVGSALAYCCLLGVRG